MGIKTLKYGGFIVSVFLASTISAQSDSMRFTFDEYLNLIRLHHPIAEKAALKIKNAQAELLGAKGNFDPFLSADYVQKNFDTKLYYNQFSSKLKIPTHYGLDVVGGYELNTGDFLNPENKTSGNGLWNVGVEANVLQGLLIDERRTALRQAKTFQEVAQNQKDIILNELFYEASLSYLEWQKQFYLKRVLEENIVIAQNYFDNTKTSFLNGEKTAIDTLEAYMLRQDRLLQLSSIEIALQKARQMVENYLWLNKVPIGLKDDIQPDTLVVLPSIILNTRDSIVRHPILLEKQNKIKYYETEQRLKREKLKPKLKIKYHPLISSDSKYTQLFSIDNYKWGADFSFPLFLRKERAAIQQGEIKIKDLDLETQNKQNELQNKADASLLQQSVLQQQLNLQQQNVEGYKQLLNAENTKFQFGESSVFLLNKRQEKYIEGALKAIELKAKLQSEVFHLRYLTNSIRD